MVEMFNLQPDKPSADNKLRLSQNDCHFSDNMFKLIFLKEKFHILIQISLKFVPNAPIANKSALVQEMAWHWTGDKPLLEPMMTYFTDAYICHQATMACCLLELWEQTSEKFQSKYNNFLSRKAI